MRIAIVGTGYVGLVAGACLADSGNEVTCVDVDVEKVARPRARRAAASTNRASTSWSSATASNSAWSSPPISPRRWAPRRWSSSRWERPRARAGMRTSSHVLAAAEEIGRALRSYTVIVDKSTVPVGTADAVAGDDPTRDRRRTSTWSPTPSSSRRARRSTTSSSRTGWSSARTRSRARADHGRALRALRAHREPDPVHGHALGGAHQVRRQRHARHAHLVHERHRAASASAWGRTWIRCARGWARIAASGTPSCSRGSATAAAASPRT